MANSAVDVTRRTFLSATVAAVATLGPSATGKATAQSIPVTAQSIPVTAQAIPVPAPLSSGDAALRELDQKIRAGLSRYGIPGAAVGVLWRGAEYVHGYGVTNVDHPTPVDGDTLFRVGSTTKTFTGTVVMRLVERGLLALDAPVHRYLPDFRTLDPSVAGRVTVRQLLNHTAGWLGDYFEDTGEGDDAVARYVAGISRVPQLTPPGKVLAYNNAAVGVAGRLVEVVTGKPYQVAVRELLLDPLGLAHSVVSTDPPAGFDLAAPHALVDGKPVVEPSFYRLWRSLHPIGGLISSARDQLRYARFHLGDGTVPGGRTRLLTPASVRAMRSHPGPGGTLFVEVDGFGVNWMLRPTAEGVRVVQHGGDWPGQHSGFLMVPERGFALTVLTNSEGGPGLLDELFTDDWALRRFAGISNLPAVPRRLTAAELAPYEGTYTQQAIGADGTLQSAQYQVSAAGGQLVAKVGDVVLVRLAFYRPDYVLPLGPAGGPAGHSRANFVRGPDGQVDWLCLGGRLSRRTPPTPLTSSTPAWPSSGTPIRPSFDVLRPWLIATTG